jgi:hypothetical protein
MSPTADLGPSGSAGRAEQLAVWSQQAVDLARDLAPALLDWPDDPAQSSQVLAGDLWELIPGLYLPGDLSPGLVDRAVLVGLAAGAELRAHHVVTGPSAAWVMLGCRPVPPLELSTPGHRGVVPGFVVRHLVLSPSEVRTIGGVPVTAPARSAADVLRFSPRGLALDLVRELVETGWCTCEEIGTLLDVAPRRRGNARARAMLSALEAAATVSARRPGCGTRRDDRRP